MYFKYNILFFREETNFKFSIKHVATTSSEGCPAQESQQESQQSLFN